MNIRKRKWLKAQTKKKTEASQPATPVPVKTTEPAKKVKVVKATKTKKVTNKTIK